MSNLKVQFIVCDPINQFNNGINKEFAVPYALTVRLTSQNRIPISFADFIDYDKVSCRPLTHGFTLSCKPLASTDNP